MENLPIIFIATKDATIWRAGTVVKNHAEMISAIADALDDLRDTLLILDGDMAGSMADALWICATPHSGLTIRRPAERFYEPNLLTATGVSLYSHTPEETSDGIARVEALVVANQVMALNENTTSAREMSLGGDTASDDEDSEEEQDYE